MIFEAEMQASLSYLNSSAAVESLARDPYWPKWDSPWWHMLLLHEMGETARIPEACIRACVAALNAMPLKIFPIGPQELPPGMDVYRAFACHCQYGTIYQVLAKWGLDVDREMPWLRPRILSYQMADGGLTCDNDAYLVKDEVPSSMVGTISVFEAILLYTPREFTAEERTFLDRAAGFLMKRQLRLGSDTQHNAGEREAAKDWLKPCFPRFYFYDVLRGLSALAIWAKKTGASLPEESYIQVLEHLRRENPDGQIRVGRSAIQGRRTLFPTPSGEWERRPEATEFPLLQKVGRVGEVSPFLSRQWAGTQLLLF